MPKNVNIFYLFCPNTGTKFREPYHSYHVIPHRVFCFGSLVILDVACCYLWLFSLYISVKIDKNRKMLD